MPGVDIKIHGRADVGMPQQYAHGLVIAFAFDASGGETVPEGMEFQRRHLKFLHQFLVIIAVCSGFGGLVRIRKYEKITVHYFHQWTDHPDEFLCHGDFPRRISGLGRVDYKFGMPLGRIHDVNPSDSPSDGYYAFRQIYILPFQGAYFSDSESGAEADVDSEVPESEMRPYMVHDFLLFRPAKHFDTVPFSGGREPERPFVV